jgi:hypothetical protein
VEALQSGALDGADMDEDVLPAAIRLNETEALLGVEPFDRACSHYCLPGEWAPECASATLPDLPHAGKGEQDVVADLAWFGECKPHQVLSHLRRRAMFTALGKGGGLVGLWELPVGVASNLDEVWGGTANPCRSTHRP